jgi:hypothetical protein
VSDQNSIFLFADWTKPYHVPVHKTSCSLYALVKKPVNKETIMMFVMLLWVCIHTMQAWKICLATVGRHIFQAFSVWIHTQCNITNTIFTWVHNTNTKNKETIIDCSKIKPEVRHSRQAASPKLFQEFQHVGLQGVQKKILIFNLTLAFLCWDLFTEKTACFVASRPPLLPSAKRSRGK